MVGTIHFFAMPFIVLMPFYVEINLSRGSEWYGFLMAGFSAGSVLGYVLAGTIYINPKRRALLMILSLSGAGLLFGFLGLVNSPLIALGVISAAGSLLGFFNINVMTIYQTTVEEKLRGRVMGLMMTITNAASPLGMLAGGLAGDLTGKNIPLIYTFCGAMILISVVVVGRQRSVLSFLSTKSPRDLRE